MLQKPEFPAFVCAYSLLFVFIPNAIQIGQKLTKLVKINMPATISITIANVPEIMCVKYNTAITTASSILITLSMVPTFFFIYFFLS